MVAMRPSDSVFARGILVRLLRDTRGAAAVMIVLAMIPLAAMAGVAVDVGRIYMVKTRLQQACDAGALAGRKSMTGATLDTSASGQAQVFFNNNYQAGYVGSRDIKFTPSVTSDYQVTATATATVPTTLTGIMGRRNQVVNVACQARYDVADADIMFVLDTTGSMACNPIADCNPASATYTRPDGTTGYYAVEQGGSKLSGLRDAVISFYDTLAKSADSSTNIRYGFVPYSSTVNVGSLLYQANPNYLVTQWQYQSRHATGDKVLSTATSPNPPATQAACDAKDQSRTPATFTTRRGDGTTFVTYTYDKNGKATVVDGVWAKNSQNVYACTVTTTTYIPVWTYEQWPYDVSNFVKGQSVADPSKITDGSNGTPFYTSRWQGCIEERRTTASASFSNTNLPPDLDPDLAPVRSVDANGMPTSSDTRWRPMWPDVTYFRGTNFVSVDNTGNDTNPYGDTTSTSVGGDYTSAGESQNVAAGLSACGKPAQRLRKMTKDEVSAYVNASDFKALGGTYHDTGMIWGTRLLSPSGLFQTDTAAWPGRQAPNRYIVFMTDGEMAPSLASYGMYGIEGYDKRVTGGAYGNQENYHNARFVAECQAAKSRNITVFVVGFGQTLNDQLKACASPGQAYYAKDNAALTTAFQKIAAQVAMLRLSK